jgi:HSP20 family molecular chaperone IbpA
MGILRWLRGDVDAFEAAKRDSPVDKPAPAEKASGGRDLHGDLVRDLDVPPDAPAATFDVAVEMKTKPGESSLEAVQPRVREERARFIVDVDLPGFREETLAVDRDESETSVSGEVSSGSFVVRLRATPPPNASEIDIRADDDLLTISFPAPFA